MEEEKLLTLADIPEKSKCVVAKIHGHGGFRNRIMELGFIKGQTVSVLKNAPLRDPIEYEVLGSHVSLRRSEASNIEVVSLEESSHPDFQFTGTEADDISNYTNRSPYPTLHLIREDSIAKAAEAFPDAAAIFERNITLLEDMGQEGWDRLEIPRCPFHKPE